LYVGIYDVFLSVAGGKAATNPASVHPILRFLIAIIFSLWDIVNIPHLLPIIHSINIAIATLQTLKGRVFTYPLAIAFF
jgi:hypothetical protein